MRTSHHQNNFTVKRHNRGEKLCRNFAALLSSFLLAFVFASMFIPIENSDALTCTSSSVSDPGSTSASVGDICDTASSDISVTVENPYYITVTSSAGSGSGVALNYTNDSGNNLGNVIAAADTVTTTSNTGRLKHLYISTTSSSSNNLVSDNTNLDNNKTYIAAGGGNTLDAAEALGDNTWGFALPSTTSGIPTNTFDTSYDTSSLSLSSKFTKVPTLGNDILIQEEIGTENTETGEYESTATVYYGTLATTDIYAGSYSNTIRYAAYSEEPVPLSTYMQDFTNEMCDDLPVDKPITLKDKRDEKTYSVTRFKDGNCWMSQNLALDGTDETTGEARVLTPADSNVSENRTLAKNITDGTGSDIARIQIYSGVKDNTTANCSYAYCVESNAPYGNMYNWKAATAGTGEAATTGTAFESVCPKGWRLPDHTGAHSYTQLLSAYNLENNSAGTLAIQQTPPDFPLAGFYNGYYGNAGHNGAYLTRTVVSNNTGLVYHLSFNSESGSLNPGHTIDKYAGATVRCVFYGDDIGNVTYMQDMTTDICNKMSEGATKTLLDPRGSYNTATAASYGIIKAKDGNCWMTYYEICYIVGTPYTFI